MPSSSLVLIVVAIVATVALIARERRAGFTWRDVLRVHGVTALGAFVGAMAFGLLERGWYALAHPGWHLLRQIRAPGAVLGMLAVAPLLQRVLPQWISVAAYADLLAPLVCFAFAGARLSCYLAGCCFGVVTDLPWGIRYPRGSPAMSLHVAEGRVAYAAAWSLPVHPLQVYFALLALAVGLIALRTGRRRRFEGQMLLTVLALHEIGKGALEFLRPTGMGGVHLAAFSLTTGAVAGLALVTQLRRSTASGGNRPPIPSDARGG